MDQDSAILSAAFAFRDRPPEPSALSERLRGLLPESLDDVPQEARKSLSDRVLAEVATDANAIAWFRTKIDSLKAYGGAKSPIDGLTYECPQGDTIWTRPSIEDEIPMCPAHHVPLELKT